MEGRTIAIIIAVLIVLGGGWYLLKGSPEQTPSPVAAGTTASSTGTAAPVPPASAAIVTYTSQGFSPSITAVKQGQTVSFVNQSSEDMWVASGVHPDHTVYDGTSRAVHCAAGYAGPVPFDECKAEPQGTTYAFTFDKVGTWPFHNHLDPSDTGKIVVTAQ